MKTSTRFGKNFFIPLLLLLWLLLNTASHAATSVYVDDGGCAGNTPCFTSIQAGVNNAGPGASTIFIFPGSYDESVDISQMGSMSGGLGDLTLRAVSASGQPAISGVAINSSSGEAIFNSVDPFPNSLTLIGINVSSQTTDGIDIEGLLGAVRLDSVDAIGSFYDGIDLRTSGAITLSNINASGNGTDGIELLTEDAGDITLTDVIANGNGLNQPEDGDGVVIDIHDGAIVFERVDASSNSDDGIRIWPNNIPTGPDSWDFGEINSITAIEVTTNGNGTFGEFNGQGFRLTSDERGLNPNFDVFGRVGDVTIINSESSSNGRTGYNLEGPTIGSIFISDTSAIGNLSEGFQIQPNTNFTSADFTADPVQFIPLVELTRVQAIDNVDDGFQIEVASSGDENLSSSIGTIRLTDVAAIRNGLDAGGDSPSDGFELDARISVEMTRVSAIGNGTDGIQIGGEPEEEAVLQGESRGVPQTITGTDLTLIGNGRDNIEADAFGNITLRTILANDSIGDPDFPPAPDNTSYDGIELQTWAGGNILVEDCQANNNLAGDGLDLNARAGGGAITVRRCEASGNFSDGIDIAKADQDGVLQDESNTNSAVLIEDVRMENNGDDGCQPQSLGPITINRACMIGNQSAGLFVMRTGASLAINDSIAENNVADGMCLRDLSGGSYTVSGSDIFGNTPGLLSASDVTIGATNLFWGAASGPTHPGNVGTGDEVIDSANGGFGTVNYTPFATASVTNGAACDVIFNVTPAQPIPPQRLIGAVQVVSTTSLWAEFLLLLTVLGLGVFVLRRAI